MATGDSKDTVGYSTTFHEQRLALFDAHIANELNESEKEQVKQHLNSCQECQQLFSEFTRFHNQFETLRETKKLSLQRAQTYASQITHTVMTRLEQGKDGASEVSQTPMRSHTTTALIPFKRRTWSIWLRVITAIACLFLLTSLLVTVYHNVNTLTPTGKSGTARPLTMAWTTQQQYTLAKNNAGVFALKGIEITVAKEFRFYYAYKWSQKSTLSIVALSTQQGKDVTLSATMQPLGVVDGYSIGVIHVQYLDRVNQTIILHILSQARENVRWQLSPLKQIQTEPHPEGGGYYELSIEQKLLSEIVWSGSVPGGKSMTAFFTNKTSTHYLFLRLNYMGEVKVITKEEYLQLSGKQN